VPPELPAQEPPPVRQLLVRGPLVRELLVWEPLVWGPLRAASVRVPDAPGHEKARNGHTT